MTRLGNLINGALDGTVVFAMLLFAGYVTLGVVAGTVVAALSTARKEAQNRPLRPRPVQRPVPTGKLYAVPDAPQEAPRTAGFRWWLAPLVVGIILGGQAAIAEAHTTLYGSPGPEQQQLQAWLDSSHAATPNVPVRLYEGNCEEDQPEDETPVEVDENPADYGPGQTAPSAGVQTCAAFTPGGGYAIYIPHMAQHPQYAAWWWHLNLLNETGHIYDEYVGGRDHHRRAFSAIYGYDPKWWWPVNPWAALNEEWEKWSMGYAFCGYGMTYGEAHALVESGEYTGFGFNPGPTEYRRTCYLMTHLPGRTGRRAPFRP